MNEQKPKIANMGMGELRFYMCAKSNGNPKVCMECRGLKTCTAGQRAMVLINESEKVANELNKEEPKKRAWETQREKARELCEQALQTGDGMKFLIEQRGLNKKQASCRFSAWRRDYKDLFEKYNVPPARVGGGHKGANTGLRRHALEYWEVCLSQPDPVAYHMEQKHVSKKDAQTVVGRARRKYEGVIKLNDEVSLADWLDEMEPEEKPTNPVQVELSKKHEEIKTECERLTEEIKTRQERLVLIKEQEDALYKVLEMFQ